MFLRRDEAILLAEGRIDGLSASLNRPVVEVEDLPPGPARAVIALHRDAAGERCLAVAVRSEGSGAVILYAFRGELNSDPVQAMDAGLQFAEGMGFLFDEDVLVRGPSAESQALEIWCEITGDELPGGGGRAKAAKKAAAPGNDEVLLLDEMVASGEAVELPEEPPPEQAEERQHEVLTKFRHAAKDASPAAAPKKGPAASPDADPEAAPAQLGKIPIVRRRRSDGGESGAREAPPLLARLLARF